MKELEIHGSVGYQRYVFVSTCTNKGGGCCCCCSGTTIEEDDKGRSMRLKRRTDVIRKFTKVNRRGLAFQNGLVKKNAERKTEGRYSSSTVPSKLGR